MTASRATLIGYFNTGDQPTEANFTDLINGVPNLNDDAFTGTGAFVRANAPAFTGVPVAPGLASSAHVDVTVAGQGLRIKEGVNARMGVAVLMGGAVTVNTTAVGASSRIMLSIQSLGTVSVPQAIGVTARVNGTSFTITSADPTDTSSIAWMIVDPAP